MQVWCAVLRWLGGHAGDQWPRTEWHNGAMWTAAFVQFARAGFALWGWSDRPLPALSVGAAKRWAAFPGWEQWP